jgi:protein-serine/threonine kinase
LESLPFGELSKIIAIKRPFADETIKSIVSNIIMALEEIRRWGIVHRDLKPENLIVNKEGFLTMVDFGTCDIIPIGEQN